MVARYRAKERSMVVSTVQARGEACHRGGVMRLSFIGPEISGAKPTRTLALP
jgi:hypothetical protein